MEQKQWSKEQICHDLAMELVKQSIPQIHNWNTPDVWEKSVNEWYGRYAMARRMLAYAYWTFPNQDPGDARPDK